MGSWCLALEGFLSILRIKQTPFILDHPELVELELLPRNLELNEDPEVLRAPYTTKSKIYFRLQATNRSLQKVTLPIIDSYVQDRVNYLETDRSSLIKRASRNCCTQRTKTLLGSWLKA